MVVDQQQEETQEQAPENPEPVEAQEQKPEGEEAPPEEAKADGEETEAAEAEPEKPEGQEPPKAEEKHRRAGGWQRKIERLERQNQLLLEQLASQRPGQQPQQATQPGKEPSPEDKAAEYINNLVQQKLAQERERERVQRQQAEFQRRTAEVRAAHPDFDEVVFGSDAPASEAVQQALLTSEHGPAIMYQLASNPAELARLSALPPLEAAREIGRLEARLSSSTAAPPKPKSAARPPAPPTSVSGSAANTRSLDDLPLSDYKRAYRSGRR